MDALADALEPVLLAALQLLAPHQRAVLVLRDLQGLSAAETAQVLGCSPSAVDDAHRLARRAVALALDGRC